MKDLPLSDEFMHRIPFKFNDERTPQKNYLSFQQSIRLHGVEFLTDSFEKINPDFYLLLVPGLSIEIEKAEAQLDEFHLNLTTQLENLQNTCSLYEFFANFYELDKAIHSCQKRYHYAEEKYFGYVRLMKEPHKEIKRLGLPPVLATYHGLIEKKEFEETPVVYHKNLGGPIKKHLSKLYMLKRSFNMDLMDYMKRSARLFFERKNVGSFYRYTGDRSDIVELALVLLLTDKIHNLNTEHANANDFIRFVCTLFQVPYTKLSSYIETIQSKHTRGDSLTKRSTRPLGRYLELKLKDRK